MPEESGLPETEEPEPLQAEECMDFDRLKTRVRNSVRKRDWEKFETPKDLAIAISVEAGELLDAFRFMKDSDLNNIRQNDQVRERIKSELEEVIKKCRKMANSLGIEL